MKNAENDTITIVPDKYVEIDTQNQAFKKSNERAIFSTFLLEFGFLFDRIVFPKFEYEEMNKKIDQFKEKIKNVIRDFD